MNSLVKKCLISTGVTVIEGILTGVVIGTAMCISNKLTNKFIDKTLKDIDESLKDIEDSINKN